MHLQTFSLEMEHTISEATLPLDAFIRLCRWDRQQRRYKQLNARRERLFRTVIVPTVRLFQFLVLAAVIASIVMVFSSARLFLFSHANG